MTSFNRDSQSIRATLLFALLASVCTAPMYSQAAKTDPATIEAKNQDQIAADTKKLYQLALELRAEVGKTYKESLSLAVIKKAEEVEKLATSLKSRMSKEAVDGH